MDKKLTGIQGEQLAKNDYREKGYEILEENYRYGRAEIDFIALSPDENLLVFVEVKNRNRKDYGDAESFVTQSQQARIKEAAEDYIYGINWKRDVRFDIVCVNKDDEMEVFEDAF